MQKDTLDTIWRYRLIYISRGQTLENLARIADALVEGGVHLMEVTFQQDKPETWKDTQKALQMLCKRYHGSILPGVGTVMTEDQVKLAYDSGAEYIIAPNLNERIVARTLDLGLVMIPGVFTPSECAAAYEMGAHFVKVFPVSVGGPTMIKAYKAPLRHIPMLAVGGVMLDTLRDYLTAGADGVGTAFQYPQALIDEGKLAGMTDSARAYVHVIDDVFSQLGTA